MLFVPKADKKAHSLGRPEYHNIVTSSKVQLEHSLTGCLGWTMHVLFVRLKADKISHSLGSTLGSDNFLTGIVWMGQSV